ncbi:hypothetical protein NQ317_008932 [Molorchus minor]|uniref:Uncharacterized protein n=1 Tax=Molorchus minor TaxID=1323400 RepID=A0ABQ9JZM7_9CUCU|nr:hypothetical protein NQ317_008932 [Molorchus minor]
MSSFPNEDGTMETVMKNIYSSCDPENSNLVPASKIIDFIAPYMLEDPIALDSLKTALDPTNGNVCVSSEQFYEIMNEWTKQIVNSSENDADKDFNRTPSTSGLKKFICGFLDQIDEKQLPYTQSTPRASFGQKLLSCEGLLNLSNVSTYSLSTSVHTKEKTAAEKTILEEEIKRLEHHLNKLANELVVVKLQLTTTEEQNEILQSDLDRCKTRLQSEQQVIEHLQNDKRYNDELRDEVNSSKKLIEDLTKKLLQYEKDSHHLYSLMEHIEKENSNLEHRCEELSRREQQAKKQIIDIKTELDLKDQEINTILKVNDELKNKLNQQKDLLDQLSNENELLDHEKSTLEKALRNNLSARRDSIVSQYQTCLADSKNFLGLDESGEEESCFKIQDTDNALYNSLQAEFSQVSFGSKSSHSDIGFSNKSQPEVNIVKDCFDCLHHLKEIKQLQSKNEDIQSKLQLAENENDQLRLQITEMEHKVLTLGQDINNLRIEKNDKEDALTKIKEDKSVLLKEKKELEKNDL